MNDSVLHNLDRGVADEKGQKLDLVLLFDHCGGSLGSGLGQQSCNCGGRKHTHCPEPLCHH